jgi:hypothetical protein
VQYTTGGRNISSTKWQEGQGNQHPMRRRKQKMAYTLVLLVNKYVNRKKNKKYGNVGTVHIKLFPK